MTARTGYAALLQYVLVLGAFVISLWIILRSIIIEPPARVIEFFNALMARFMPRPAAS